MSTPLANLDTARAHMFAQFHEVFPSVTARPLRLALLREVTGHPLETTRTFTEEQYRWTARRLRELAEDRARADRILHRAAAELAPDPELLASAADSANRCGRSRADLSNLDTALALLDRLGEVTHDARFAVGDAGNMLLSLAPEAKPYDVLREHLRGRERDQLRALLCPSFPPLDGLPLDLALKFEQSAVREWLTCCRVSERVPEAVRNCFPGLGYGFFRAAALTLQVRDGRKLPPTPEEVARRLAAATDNETVFLSPADLRRWALSGAETLPERTQAEKPDLIAEAWEFFKQRFHELDNTKEAFVETFQRYRRAAGRTSK